MPRRSSTSAPVAVQAPPGPRLADWNLLRSFAAIHETGTLSAAALRLGTTQPSMGRHLRELERQLGETLFVRLPGRLQPTARADALFETTLAMRQAARDAEGLFSGGHERVAGVVRVAVSEAYAYHVLPRLLMPLLREHAGLEVELAVSNRTDNLLRRDADIAVRFFRPPQPELIARKVGDTELGLYVHQDYIARHGLPTSLSLPEGAVAAGFDREPFDLSRALPGGPPQAPLRFRLRSDSVMAREAAVDCGLAMGMYFTDIAVHRPGLQRVLADQVRLPQAVWLCAHDELRRSSRMRRVWDCLDQGLQAHLAAR
jgi:DNA-binding transcriptional LysR family regulator